MKKTALISVVLLLLAALAVQAKPGWGDGSGGRGQGKGGPGDCRMIGDGPGRLGPGHRGQGDRGPGHLAALKTELGLSDAQVSQLETMSVRFRTEMVDLRAAVQKAQIQLRALKRDDAEAASVNRAIDEVSRLRADLQKQRYNHHLETMGVLTPEQQTELEKLRDQRRASRWEDRSGRRGQGRGPAWDDD